MKFIKFFLTSVLLPTIFGFLGSFLYFKTNNPTIKTSIIKEITLNKSQEINSFDINKVQEHVFDYINVKKLNVVDSTGEIKGSFGLVDNSAIPEINLTSTNTNLNGSIKINPSIGIVIDPDTKNKISQRSIGDFGQTNDSFKTILLSPNYGLQITDNLFGSETIVSNDSIHISSLLTDSTRIGFSLNKLQQSFDLQPYFWISGNQNSYLDFKLDENKNADLNISKTNFAFGDFPLDDKELNNPKLTRIEIGKIKLHKKDTDETTEIPHSIAFFDKKGNLLKKLP